MSCDLLNTTPELVFQAICEIKLLIWYVRLFVKYNWCSGVSGYLLNTTDLVICAIALLIWCVWSGNTNCKVVALGGIVVIGVNTRQGEELSL